MTDAPLQRRSETPEEAIARALYGDAAKKIAALEAAMLAQGDPIDLPLEHVFTPGLYARTIRMPKGALVTSKIHKTEHPFVITQGKVVVWTEDEGAKLITAPYQGVTKPGTRRVLYVVEDTVWTTYHAVALMGLPGVTDPAAVLAEKDVEAIVDSVTQRHTPGVLQGAEVDTMHILPEPPRRTEASP